MANTFGKIYNVHGNITYRWTISKRNEILGQVPYIILTEYRQDMSALLSSFARFAYLGSNAGGQIEVLLERTGNAATRAGSINPMDDLSYNPYKGLYQAQPTGNVYLFPWYSQYHHEISSSWDDNTGALEDIVSTYGDKVTRFLTPAGGLDVPKAWQTLQPGNIQYEISLINTDFEQKEFNQGINNHMNLIDSLILANLPIRDGFMTMLPPCIYTMLIPGIRYSPACCINFLEVTNIGQLNRYNLGGKRTNAIVPDEWKIRFMITELVRESNVIYKGAMDVSKQIEAISTDSLSQEVQPLVKSIANGTSTSITAITDYINKAETT